MGKDKKSAHPGPEPKTSKPDLKSIPDSPPEPEPKKVAKPKEEVAHFPKSTDIINALDQIRVVLNRILAELERQRHLTEEIRKNG